MESKRFISLLVLALDLILSCFFSVTQQAYNATAVIRQMRKLAMGSSASSLDHSTGTSTPVTSSTAAVPQNASSPTAAASLSSSATTAGRDQTARALNIASGGVRGLSPLAETSAESAMVTGDDDGGGGSGTSPSSNFCHGDNNNTLGVGDNRVVSSPSTSSPTAGNSLSNPHSPTATTATSTCTSAVTASNITSNTTTATLDNTDTHST